MRRRVFISYHHVEPDRSLATKLSRALLRHYDVFIDTTISPGEDWAKRIDQELAEADYFITLLSADSVQSEMLLGEIEKAYHHSKTIQRKPIIIPVRLAYEAILPYPLNGILGRLQHLTWRGNEDTAKVLHKLISYFASDEDSVHSLYSEPLPLVSQPASGVPRLEIPGGAMDSASEFYITRGVDAVVDSILRQEGVTITIQGSRQTGKTSLLTRLLSRGNTESRQGILIDFQLFDRTVSAQGFFRHFCFSVAEQLGLESRVDTYLNSDLPLPLKMRCTNFFTREILANRQVQLTLAIDEADRIAPSKFSSEFYSMLRAWHNRRHQIEWKRLNLILVTATEPYALIKNTYESPFNVGELVHVGDFELREVIALNALHGSPLRDSELDDLMRLLSGQPFLTRRALYLITAGRYSTSSLLQSAAEDGGAFSDHLRYQYTLICHCAELLKEFKIILSGRRATDEIASMRLEGVGLVRRKNGLWIPRCGLYARYFAAVLNA